MKRLETHKKKGGNTMLQVSTPIGADYRPPEESRRPPNDVAMSERTSIDVAVPDCDDWGSLNRLGGDKRYGVWGCRGVSCDCGWWVGTYLTWHSSRPCPGVVRCSGGGAV